ncbi:DUF3383 domain-containing protein [Pragia fontium]|uniref:DUF3383 domain-containing protein n=1 Tax=Pragia fontium DSM 5563 = ATCC 49100 TaxID=1122977 RepID=A0AAJ4WAP5_9GAMM|nr:DUF3383 domain-containing protein [Pragia fontium]SFC86103.1 Protein of unknown function [Pragia fontium DSM 5563 = ATCC 49100]VEJ56115.1 Protein of uncharacterised function (DUF3383) [Pragia fontium]
MSLPLSQIVNVQLNSSPVAPFRRDFGTLALFTPEYGHVFTDPNTVFIECATQNDVEKAFGSRSETAAASRLFFSQTPKPKQLIIARWNNTTQTISAVEAAVEGYPVSTTLADMAYITDGYLSLVADGQKFDISGLDLSSGVSSFTSIATMINSLLPKTSPINVIFDEVGQRFIIKAKNAGQQHSVDYVVDSALSGTYIGKLLQLENGQAEKLKGGDAATISVQSLPEAFTALQNKNPNWYAASIVAALTDSEIQAASDWIQASDKKVLGLTTLKSSHIENSNGNIFKKLVDKQNDRTVVLYDKNDQYAINSWLARALAVNFSANNSTITMKFKSLPGVSADDLTLTEANKCKALGLNYYTYFDQAAMVAEGTVLGKRFFDEVHILDWFIDAVEKETFAVLYQSPTKVPLTDAGTARLIAAVKKVCLEGIKNGAFAPGVWNGDSFGTLNSGDRLDDGFYVWADTVDNLSISDREQRKSPPIQVAVKLAGAIHSVDVMVNFNR